MAREDDVNARWLKRFARLPPAAVKATQAELNKQAQILENIMRAGVPRGDDAVLASTIRSERGRNELQVVLRAGGPLTTVNGYDYAGAVEWGTERMSAQPFFFPAYRLRRKAIRSAIRRTVSKAIKADFERG